jgi:peptidylprolyl isomerase
LEQAKHGDKVVIHYAGKLADGTVFDSTGGRAAFEFTVGSGTVIPGFDRAVLGMKPGDSKSETIAADEAYGPHRGELVVEVERQHLPAGFEFGVGQQLQVQTPEGHATQVVVIGISDGHVTLDGNHPLAGKDLTFDIELVEIA